MEFKELPINNPLGRPQVLPGVKIPKAKLNPNNARKYLPLFVRAIESGYTKELFVSAKSAGYTVATLQNRLAEAIRFLTVQDFTDCKYKKEDFLNLRKRIKFYAVNYGGEDGVMLRYTKVGIRIEDSILELDTNVDSNPIWKTKVLDFINDPSKQHLSLDGTQQIGGVLTPDDIEWIKRNFVQLDIEHTVEPLKITALK